MPASKLFSFNCFFIDYLWNVLLEPLEAGHVLCQQSLQIYTTASKARRLPGVLASEGRTATFKTVESLSVISPIDRKQTYHHPNLRYPTIPSSVLVDVSRPYERTHRC